MHHERDLLGTKKKPLLKILKVLTFYIKFKLKVTPFSSIILGWLIFSHIS